MIRTGLVLPLLVLGFFLPAPAPGGAAAPRCIRIGKAGTRVSGDIKICPGRYRISDHAEQGVLVITASNTKIDLTGVTIESGDSLPGEYLGYGILSRRGDSISIRGGRIRGYRHGVRLEGGRGHRISGIDLSGSRTQVLRSTPEKYDEADWLDIFRQYAFEAYGTGLYLKYIIGAQVTGVIARGSQNGIGLFESRDVLLCGGESPELCIHANPACPVLSRPPSRRTRRTSRRRLRVRVPSLPSLVSTRRIGDDVSPGQRSSRSGWSRSELLGAGARVDVGR